jgi:holo-ACP synthase CitX
MQWIERYKMPLISYTLNIPGPCKQSAYFDRVHEIGLHMLLLALPVVNYNKLCLPTGSEALLACAKDARRLKMLTVSFEQHHPLGRLFDMDVLDGDGEHLSRRDLGLPPRQCLLCREDAAVCARNQTHSITVLLKQITGTIEGYFSKQPLFRCPPTLATSATCLP